MKLEFSLKNQEALYKELKQNLNNYFKPYQIKLLQTEIYFDFCTKGDEGWNVIYAICVEVNEDKNNELTAMCEFVTDGTKVISVEFPEIPDSVNKVVENTL